MTRKDLTKQLTQSIEPNAEMTFLLTDELGIHLLEVSEVGMSGDVDQPNCGAMAFKKVKSFFVRRLCGEAILYDPDVPGGGVV